MFRWQLLVLLATITVIEADRKKRQLSIDDLISKALSLVQPIFDTSQPLQYNEMLKEQPVPSTDDLRDSIILGSHAANPLDNIPLCKGNNRICQFISCSAENFKKDPTFGNIQLAAQMLSDKKLRQTISRFITTIESKSQVKIDDPPRSLPALEVEQEENDNVIADDAWYGTELSQERSKVLGSKTWSTHHDKAFYECCEFNGQGYPYHPAFRPQPFEIRNDLVASLTPPPPALFVYPTPPSAPPLAFPTVPSFIFPSISLPTSVIDKLLQTKIDPVIRRQRDIDFDTVDLEPDLEVHRVRRDYYDGVYNKPSPDSSSASSLPSDSEDYYGNVDESKPKQHELSSPLKDCVHILGIY